MQLVDFHSLAVKDRIHVLGRGIDGTVIATDTNPYGKHRTVTVAFDDGKEVSYTKRSLSATRTDTTPPTEPVIKRPADPLVAVLGTQKVRRAAKIQTSVPRPRKQRLARKPVRTEKRPIPMIPGPPVPKPLRGVWGP